MGDIQTVGQAGEGVGSDKVDISRAFAGAEMHIAGKVVANGIFSYFKIGPIKVGSRLGLSKHARNGCKHNGKQDNQLFHWKNDLLMKKSEDENNEIETTADSTPWTPRSQKLARRRIIAATLFRAFLRFILGFSFFLC